MSRRSLPTSTTWWLWVDGVVHELQGMAVLSINQALTLPMRLHAQVFEGRLLRADTTGLVLKLSRGQHGEILMLSSRQVRSIHPRFAEGTGSGRRPERCSYFEDCGKCAFGAGCRKTHDPRLLSQDAQCAVANGEDMAMRQQLTLHLATIPEGYDEARIRHEFAKYGKIQSVNICHKTSLLMGKGKEHWRFVCCPCVCSIALPLFAEAGPMRSLTGALYQRQERLRHLLLRKTGAACKDLAQRVGGKP